MKIGLIFCVFPFTLGLISATPLFSSSSSYPSFYRRSMGLKATRSHQPLGVIDYGKSQWIGAATRLVDNTIGSRILNNVVDCRVCGNCNAELQQDTDIEERSAKIMALVQIMDEINAAKESLNELEKLSMKDYRIAETELVSGEISSIGDALGNAGEYLKGAAKNVLCR